MAEEGFEDLEITEDRKHEGQEQENNPEAEADFNDGL